MQEVGSIADAEQVLLTKINEWLAKTRRLTKADVDTVASGIRLLFDFRRAVYEDLNQIQHAALLLGAAEWLEKNVLHASARWRWNPYQTGGADEPDLRCVTGSVTIVAEGTTSAKPGGTIEKRMVVTLRKLNGISGEKYYFVKTNAMKQRAETKIRKAGWKIQVVLLP